MTRAAKQEDSEFDSRFPRRLLFAGAAAGIAGTAVVATAAPAEAASATTPWMLGGNSGVTTSNFIGPTTAAIPLIFKTRAYSTSPVTEKMRLTPSGALGIGVTSPVSKLDVASGGVTIQGTSSGTGGTGRGVLGTAAGGYGLEGRSDQNIAVFGRGVTGVKGSGTQYGVWGEGNTYGAFLQGSTIGSYCLGDGYGVYGAGITTGVYGQGVTGVAGYSTDNGSGTAVSGSGGVYGVHGADATSAGVRGDSGYVGVWGAANVYGVYGNATSTTGTNYGVYGTASSGYAVYASGNAHVTGTLSKAAGSFRIDHPLDPEKKWLSHSFVESPDMMNIYNGNVTTDGSGSAVIQLPDYFTALNRDFRYQLTVIGVFAQAIVSKKVSGTSFTISTDKPKVEVSWQVTGIRQDDYAKEHPIVVETVKEAPDAGTRQFVPKGSSAKALPGAPGEPKAPATPPPPLDAKKPQDLATT